MNKIENESLKYNLAFENSVVISKKSLNEILEIFIMLNVSYFAENKKISFKTSLLQHIFLIIKFETLYA